MDQLSDIVLLLSPDQIQRQMSCVHFGFEMVSINSKSARQYSGAPSSAVDHKARSFAVPNVPLNIEHLRAEPLASRGR